MRRLARPTFHEELALRAEGCAHIAGVDEAGRGPLAGPVVAAAVILPQSWFFRTRRSPRSSGPRTAPPHPALLVNDSKLLSAEQREWLFGILVRQAVAWGVGCVEADAIDMMGIAPATRLAMRRAIEALGSPPQALLVDAVDLSETGLPCKAIIDGDALCGSISAASIIAKVHRDRIMAEMDRRYPGYGFARHKGYGTTEHMRRLRELGPCPVHRRTFAPIRELISSRGQS